MAKLYLAVIWHQHQPCYTDPATGAFALPWVRLHAAKDYIGMANLLAEFPALKQTINFVPSLIKQINEYAAGTTDPLQALARLPADSLTRKQAAEIISTAFMLNWDNMVQPYPRFRQLLARTESGQRPAAKVAREFNAADLRDLQVWSNLAWFHPTVVEKDARLGELVQKGRDFTEEEKLFVMARQLELLAEVLPLHRRLAESGQLELISSPFYHPIVPLLCDYRVARVARPNLTLPAPMLTAPEDAAGQIKRALALHEATFGRRPRGMWPPEGAVSDEAAAVYADAGVEWLATDEDILAQTLRLRFSRDHDGAVNQPDKLYRPWRLVRAGRRLRVLFRDHILSDLIGFRYQDRPGEEAAKDLMDRLEAVRKRAPENSLVVIALDGENCWESYPKQGIEFLRDLYRRLSDSEQIETVRVSDYLDRFGDAGELDHIHPGSWIGHSFATWVGHWEKNRAWECLSRARQSYAEKTAAGAVAPGVVAAEKAAAALEEIYIAEGSDWFWWFGDDHSSGNDAQFDALFRRHIRKAYELLGARPPDDLLKPIIDKTLRESWRPPRGMLNVQVDGRRTSFFEWLGAGSYEQARDVSAMERSEPVPVAAMYFGFGAETLFLRFDPSDAAREASRDLTFEVWLSGADHPAASASFGPGGVKADEGVRAARDRIIELGVPLTRLGLSAGRSAEFFVRVLERDSAAQRIPASGSLPLAVPADAESAYSAAEDLV